MNLNIRLVIKMLSFVILLLAIAMLPSLLVSLIYREFSTAIAFIKIIVPLLIFGYITAYRVKTISTKLGLREGFLIVALSWLSASLLGSFPYLLTDTIDGFVNAFFESTSGFTTTGASVISDIENLPKGILFWRSFCQWIGGMGILIFAISILPALGISGQRIARAETPGPSLNKVVPRMSDSAKILYAIYIAFTLAAVALLLAGGLNPFDAFIAAFGSVASGGLSNYNLGIAHFNSSYVEGVSALFTILSCVNFTLYYSAIRGKWHDFFTDRELWAFLLVLCAGAVLITGNLWHTGSYSSFAESLRFGFFQTSAFLTTTGHFSADFNLWPAFSKMVLFLLMLIGGCSSSTGGGIKIIRIVILFKLIQRGFFVRLHPRAIVPVKIQGKTISTEVMTGVMSFLCLYVFVFLLSSLVLSFENLDLLTTFTATAAVLNNVGTGLELVGPTGSFALFSDFTKIYLSFLMLMGRLELFTIILLFTPSFWNPDR